MKTNINMLSVILFSLLLNACGGAGNNIASNGDGITGTGITAGRVTAFGSIYVNGIKFNVDNATFTRDGVSAGITQNNYSIGEYIVIKGPVNGTTGVASEVIFEDLLEGVVTTASSDNIRIEILGQKVEVDNNTQFIEFTSHNPKLTDLDVGNIVEVSGVKDTRGVIKATGVKFKQSSFVVNESENEIKGVVAALDTSNKTFMIGNILVDYDQARFDGFTEQALTNGQYVEAKSNKDIEATTLVASKIELKDKHLNIETGNDVEIEGLVTRLNTIQDFDLNGIHVTTNTQTNYKHGTANDITLNAEIEVKGKVNSNNVLVAEEVEFED